ncbi:PREDICTED: CKLF-like MARVEL transmembrane domain-containing protein 2 [Hipposideros armiger]|uniref:CKLF-like MARVEL transmembrane domain-containing protein 2 n=1 Tax=Hipposideros armiger TaxID=186990 RepID=A0A8B7S8Y7_HIPAR|nr:PREDICTED: CKLF-like MARVEL transmembrane domain-containing protein 2 [Hipposideros armiger]
MAEKSKKDKARAKQTAPQTPEEHYIDESLKEQKPVKKKSEQPKDDVGTRKGCRRYRWELKDSNKEFWVMGHAEVKILSLGCLTAAMVMFTGTAVHPILTLIITMEISIFSFFFFVHTFAVQRYMPFILWPISELLNDLFSTIFLAGAVFFAVKSRKTMPMNYFIAVILISLAGFFALIDICLQRNHFRGKRIKKNVLVPPEKQQPAKDAEAAKPKEKPTTHPEL